MKLPWVPVHIIILHEVDFREVDVALALTATLELCIQCVIPLAKPTEGYEVVVCVFSWVAARFTRVATCVLWRIQVHALRVLLRIESRRRALHTFVIRVAE